MHRYSWYLAAIVWVLWAIGIMLYSDANSIASVWPITPTMLVGSFIAGSTSAGGGAVAFPVMTLVFGVQPTDARDFCLMIQTVGMGAASIGIVLMRIRVEWKAIALSNIGGLIGIAVGLQIAATWPPAFTKMFFVSLWLAIALALFLINRGGRSVVERMDHYGTKAILAIVGIGIVGGFVSGLTGSGLDILTFALLTMAYRLSETVATPTSVIIMACNSALGVMLQSFTSGLSEQAIQYWWAAVPVVVIGAPLGAWYIRNKSRDFITSVLYVSIAVQFIGALLIVPQTTATVALSATVVTVGSATFLAMSRLNSSKPNSIAA